MLEAGTMSPRLGCGALSWAEKGGIGEQEMAERDQGDRLTPLGAAAGRERPARGSGL